MKAVVAAFNQEKALVGAFFVITNLQICFGWNFVAMSHYTHCAQARDWVVTTLNSYHPIRSAGTKAASTNTVSAASWG